MKPTLLVLAAGMGSRYGGLKQLDGVGPNGQTIMDYSIFDAIRSGFGKVVFVIRRDFEEDIRKSILSKYIDHIPVEVVFQAVDSLPEGFNCPEERVKPWGTNHAVLMGQSVINEPFAVINADDFYGRNSFEVIANELSKGKANPGEYCMVGFHVGNTLSESGTVSRGVCTTKDGCLDSVVERTSIGYDGKGGIEFADENGDMQPIEAETLVSMNMWGFTPDYFEYSNEYFKNFLKENINNLKAEFYIPSMVNYLLENGKAKVKMLESTSKWFGVTYAEDRPGVVEKLAELHLNGEYPEKMFL